MLERNNHSWLAGLPDLRYHIFPVHASRKLLEMPTLGASLYLLVFHFLQRRYAEVCASAVSCTSDTELSPEESQVWHNPGACHSQCTCAHLYCCCMENEA